MADIREQIIRLRRERGWSRRALARAAGVSEGAVRAIEDCRTEQPRRDTVARIAKALDSTEEALSNTPPRPGAVGQPGDPLVIGSLVGRITRLEEDTRALQRHCAMIEALLAQR